MSDKIQLHVLVTSAGTASAISTIKGFVLQDEFEVKTVACDMDPMAPGLFLADTHYLTPSLKDPGIYLDRIEEIIQKENIQLVIPTLSAEISLFAEHRDRFNQVGLHTLLHPKEAVDLLNDKQDFAQHMHLLGIPTPRVFGLNELRENGDSLLPVFSKPRVGSSSKGVEKIETIDRLREMVELHDPENMVIQEYLSGDEYTIDVLSNLDCQPIVISARQRISVKAGQSVKAQISDATPFTAIIEKVCTDLKLVGPCNFQFMLDADNVSLIEINPRLAAGGLMLTIHAGANIPFLIAKLALGHEIESEMTQVKVGMRMTRYWQEIILP